MTWTTFYGEVLDLLGYVNDIIAGIPSFLLYAIFIGVPVWVIAGIYNVITEVKDGK